jgi:hypothetical protein
VRICISLQEKERSPFVCARDESAQRRAGRVMGESARLCAAFLLCFAAVDERYCCVTFDICKIGVLTANIFGQII